MVQNEPIMVSNKTESVAFSLSRLGTKHFHAAHEVNAWLVCGFG
jgi:hypothetical protein